MPLISIGVTGELSKSLFEWKISNFFDLEAEKNSYYKSPSFVVDNTSFHLNIFPSSHPRAQPGFISVFLENESDFPVRVFYQLHIKKADGMMTLCCEGDHTFEASVAFGRDNFYNRSDLLKNRSELVPSGILTIVCTLTTVNKEEIPVKADNAEVIHQEQTCTTLNYQRLAELETLSENFRNLFHNKESCDVTLNVTDREFKAHKAVLMARSPVFAAMFQHNTSEKQTDVINILDCDPESFEKFLEFLYSGKIEELFENDVLNLYVTSEKYQIQGLKIFCSEYLIKHLSVENLCDIVIFADKYGDKTLSSETQVFFNNNLNQIFMTSEWDNLLNNYRSLAKNLLVQMSTKVKVDN